MPEESTISCCSTIQTIIFLPRIILFLSLVTKYALCLVRYSIDYR
ncbi:hypothetical protein H206_05302 [Candidatus Electrothrix aarhusensis]|uniref:Uncharacterized protein n=1 Tax=Candidatus Electrothrix aarhusensis TaxID=1859131 RepID=A0A3S3QLY3_9BACT|nr:hypothetical protein H206_05302 [Candidatus Electrothrix aarhusensis]